MQEPPFVSKALSCSYIRRDSGVFVSSRYLNKVPLISHRQQQASELKKRHRIPSFTKQTGISVLEV